MTNEAVSVQEALGEPAVVSAAQAVKDAMFPGVAEIESLSQEEAVSMIGELADAGNFNNFKLGGVLSLVQANSWWKSDDGKYESFKAFIEEQYGIAYRKAMYLISIYNSLVDSKVPYSKIKDVSWTKLKELAPILTPENVDEWVKKAAELTVLQLQAAIKAAQTGKLNAASDDSVIAAEQAKITTLTFRVHPDQKETIKAAVEKARSEASTEYDGVALEAICMGYLSGASKAAPEKSLVEIFKGKSYKDLLDAFEAVFPDIDLKVSVPEKYLADEDEGDDD